MQVAPTQEAGPEGEGGEEEEEADEEREAAAAAEAARHVEAREHYVRMVEPVMLLPTGDEAHDRRCVRGGDCGVHLARSGEHHVRMVMLLPMGDETHIWSVHAASGPNCVAPSAQLV